MIARGIRIAQASSSTTSIVLLVAFNLVPLVGVLFWGWNVATILVIYWVENGIIGILNVPKILLARGQPAPGMTLTINGRVSTSNVGAAAFFLVHYGIFWVVHGVFVWTLPMMFGVINAVAPGPVGGFAPFAPFGPDGTVAIGSVVRTGPHLAAIGWAALGLGISHGASFIVNYLGRREYLRVSAGQQMFAPYGRLVILHLAILFGAFVSLAIGSPVGAIAVLVVLKTVVDLGFHLREHGRFGPAGWQDPARQV